ncbi:MAG: DNRLRE domain-containing protein, partial [Verrucomicrobia bacterium]|nr:DNRLRE domain-containing protein [Verrucomicrobiota bacterium]
RNIVSVDGNQITIDSPVVMAMEERWGGGYIFKYDDSARLTQVGIEGMRVMLYNQMRNGELSHVRGTVVRFNRVRHGWADDVVAEHFYDRVFDVRDSKYITIRDSAVLMAPARYFSGYVPHYGFNLTRGLTSHVLVTGCFTRNNRHAYVLDARVPGPNVFHDSVGAQSRTWSEPHHRWSTGGLYDNVDDLIAFHNRLSSGTGHGWSGVNFVAWNTRGTLASQRPPTAQNWAIGHVGVKSNGSNLNWVPAGDDGSYDGGGHGHWELHRTGGANSVQPKSLYEYQRDLHYSLIIRHTNAGEPLHLPRNHYPFETALAIGEGLQLEASDLSHHWEVVSAPGTYHLQGIGTLTPSIIMSAPGTYTLRVRVYQAGQTEPLEEAFFSVELLPTAESNLTRTATLTDDTFAQNGEPNTNFGSEDILRMKHLSTNQYGRESYLKFTLPDLETFEINSARLRLFSVNSFTEHEGTVVLLDSNNWSEGTLTWDNRPTAGITAATWAHDGTIGWLEIDLDSSALELLSNAGTVSFRLSVDWQSENAPVLNLASKDGPHEANRAQLLIQGAKVYTYADWLQDEGIPEEEQAPELDRFGNGVSNLEAYLTGVSAENPAPPNNHLENSTWHINLPWRNSVPHAYFFIEQSSDLKTWTPLPWDLWQASPLDDQRTRYETSIRMEDILHEPDPGLLFLRLRFAK